MGTIVIMRCSCLGSGAIALHCAAQALPAAHTPTRPTIAGRAPLARSDGCGRRADIAHTGEEDADSANTHTDHGRLACRRRPPTP